VYGVVEPESGDNFFREISHLDTECLEFLNDFQDISGRFTYHSVG